MTSNSHVRPQCNWKHCLDPAEWAKLQLNIQDRIDFKVVYEDKFATLYQCKKGLEKPLTASLQR